MVITLDSIYFILSWFCVVSVSGLMSCVFVLLFVRREIRALLFVEWLLLLCVRAVVMLLCFTFSLDYLGFLH